MLNFKNILKRYKKIKIQLPNIDKNNSNILEELKDRNAIINGYLNNIRTTDKENDLYKINIIYQISRCEDLLKQLNSKIEAKKNMNFQRFFCFDIKEVMMLKIISLCIVFRSKLLKYNVVVYDYQIRDHIFFKFSNWYLFFLKYKEKGLKNWLKKYL